ncbi:MAG TPA: hypothetical protein VFA12_00615 [Stellaceae bacterium]|nr:hypothetical protein [Stellaceae bacterium]
MAKGEKKHIPRAAEEAADKVRRSAEAEAGRAAGDVGHGDARSARNSHAAAAHDELTDPRHSAGRPGPQDGRKRPSNAGNDGP